MMCDIKIVKGRTRKEALELAKMEYGNNFTILRDKTVKTGGFLGIGQKEVCQVSIALFENKFQSDKKEIKKHAPIDGEKIAEGMLNIEKYILDNNIHKRPSDFSNTVNTNNFENTNIAPHTNKLDVNIADNVYDINVQDNINNNLNSYKPQNINRLGNVVMSNVEIDNKTAKINNALSSIKSVREQSKTNNKDVYNYIDKKIDGMEDKICSILSEFLQNNNNKKNMPSSVANNKIADNSNLKMPYKSHMVDNLKRNSYLPQNKYKTYIKNSDHSSSYTKRKRPAAIELEALADNKLIQPADKDVYLKINKQKLKNKNFVIDSILDKVRKKEFPDALIEDIRKFLKTSSNARFIQSENVVQDEILRYFDENLILQSGIQLSNRKKIVILVGPTGVGKTTTIPKLAAPHIRAKREVCFITLDSYRIAAEEQLAKYAAIMKIPFTTIKKPDDLRNEVRKMGANSILFIDTIGRSPKATKDIVQMSKYFSSIGRFDIDINILLSATSKYSDALNILDKFKVTNYKSTIITKLDETNYLAPVLAAVIKNKLPVSNVTYGQSVPNDISDALKGKNRIMKGLYGGGIKC